MNKFKRDAEILGSIRPDDYPSQDQFIAIGNAADFFDSIATLANEAPDPGYFVSLKTASSKQIDYVLKEYAEYWKSRCAIFFDKLPKGMEHCTIEFKECEKGHGRLTASAWGDIGCLLCANAHAQQRIKNLNNRLLDKITEESQAIGLYDEPKLVMTQNEFCALEQYIYSIVNNANGNPVFPYLPIARDIAHKALCGK